MAGGLVLVTVGVAGRGYFAAQFTAAREELKARQATRELQENATAHREVENVIQADLINALHLADTALSKEAQLRAIERAEAAATLNASPNAAFYVQTAATLDQTVVRALHAYRDALLAIGQNTRTAEKLRPDTEGGARDVRSAMEVLARLEAAGGIAISPSRRLAFRILREHVSVTDAAKLTPVALRQTFVTASKELYATTSAAPSGASGR